MMGEQLWAYIATSVQRHRVGGGRQVVVSAYIYLVLAPFAPV